LEASRGRGEGISKQTTRGIKRGEIYILQRTRGKTKPLNRKKNKRKTFRTEDKDHRQTPAKLTGKGFQFNVRDNKERETRKRAAKTFGRTGSPARRNENHFREKTHNVKSFVIKAKEGGKKPGQVQTAWSRQSHPQGHEKATTAP